uniref:SAP domain-containing protein n=1 Tax=Elaeophora elaphi TaxID=1147741 RepID=A0A0R3RZS3_9BILA
MTIVSLQVVQLREQLRSRGLPTDGTKVALIERLKGSYAAEETILNSDASALKDSLDEYFTEETVLEGAINEDDILGPDTSVKKKEDLAPAAMPSAPSITPLVHVAGESKSNQRPEVSKETEAVINSLDAKLKRAQRFGLPLSDEQMKQKRAERFGIQLNAGTANVGGILAEKKKQRAERFGIISESEKMQEILDRRAKRFGIDNKANAVISGQVEKTSLEVLERRGKRFGLCSEEAELEIKKQKRAERFGLNKN